MPEGAIYVGRPTRWGNPFHVGADWLGAPMTARDTVLRFRSMFERFSPKYQAVELAPLAGRDLACWCKLDQPCHADVLLEMANR